jgi:cobyrinic acid a,c-diamide synthase
MSQVKSRICEAESCNVDMTGFHLGKKYCSPECQNRGYEFKHSKLKSRKHRDQMSYRDHVFANQEQAKQGTNKPNTSANYGKVRTSSSKNKLNTQENGMF